MSLEKELRLFDSVNCKQHHHQTEEGKLAINLMATEIKEHHFKHIEDAEQQDKAFRLAYFQWQSKAYLCETENLGDESYLVQEINIDGKCFHQDLVLSDPASLIHNEFYNKCLDCTDYTNCKDYESLGD